MEPVGDVGKRALDIVATAEPPEPEALGHLFRPIRQAVSENGCTRAILVGHNASFDLGFVNAAVARTDIKRNPFHPFSTFDTVTLAGMAFGQTVLSRAIQAAGLAWDDGQAHSAVYDTERTAQLFCAVLNRWRQNWNPWYHNFDLPLTAGKPALTVLWVSCLFSDPSAFTTKTLAGANPRPPKNTPTPTATHSQSGIMGHHMVRILKERGRLDLVKGLITIEGGCSLPNSG